MSAKREKKKEVSFEENLARLEAIVSRLEEGSLSLEDSLEAFEEGMAIYRQCASTLENARQRIEKLVKDGEKLVSVPFDFAEEDNSTQE